MKLFFRRILIKSLQPFGFYITYYASPSRIFEALSKQPVIIQEYELKRIFDTIAIAKNFKFYDELLRKFTSGWDLEIKHANFIGFGAGESSLSTFRRVKIDKEILHEKIYFSSHQDLKRIKWLYEEAYELITKSEIALPEIYKIYSGDALTVLYSEYLDLNDLKTLTKEKQLVEFSKKLYKISLNHEFNTVYDDAPIEIKNFKNHFEYKNNRPIAKKILVEHKISIEILEQNILRSRHVLTHGDIQDTNAFENNVLIDWDSVGIYPAGLDSAFLLFYQLLKDEKNEKIDIVNWLDIHYKKMVYENEWNDFKNSVIFFLFVFIQRRITGKKYQVLNDALIVHIKNTFNSSL